MKKNDFKFECGQKVFILGHDGVSMIWGRGKFNYLSGGKVNLYFIRGAHSNFFEEQVLLSVSDMEGLLK